MFRKDVNLYKEGTPVVISNSIVEEVVIDGILIDDFYKSLVGRIVIIETPFVDGGVGFYKVKGLNGMFISDSMIDHTLTEMFF